MHQQPLANAPHAAAPFPSAPFPVCAPRRAQAEDQRDQTEALRPMLAVWAIDLMLDYTRDRPLVDAVTDDENELIASLLGPELAARLDELRAELDEQDSADFPREHPGRRGGLTSSKVRAIKKTLRWARSRLVQQPMRFDTPFWINLRTLGVLLGLSEAQLFIVCLGCALEGAHAFRRMLDSLCITTDHTLRVECLARLGAQSAQQIKEALSPTGTLCSTGLIGYDAERSADIERIFEVRGGLFDLLFDRVRTEAELLSQFVAPAPSCSLTPDDFPHLKVEFEAVRGLLTHSSTMGRKGSNLLFYGPPGVGKTEAAVALTRSLGLTPFEVRYLDSDGDPLNGKARLREFVLSQHLLADNPDAILIFDEVEDVFGRSDLSSLFGDSGSVRLKAWLNRTLEQTAVPAIWITNDLNAIDPAYRRRFDYVIQFGVPPAGVRQGIAGRYLSKWSDDADWLRTIAANPALTPAQLSQAARLAESLTGGDADEASSASTARRWVQHALETSARVLDQPRHAWSFGRTTEFDLAYVNADVELDAVIAALRARPLGTFCFYGPPGTGKSELGRYIATQLDREVIVKRASDLLSMWVGGTEGAIAAMFDEARLQGAVLVLDEADSFLRSRQKATHSWEVTQVNELLTQMEAFEGVFICTTNLVDHLDPASLRRFDWKLRFQSLSTSQRWALFAQEFVRLGGSFDEALACEAAVRSLEGLTAGDIATVVRQHRLLATAPDAAQFVKRLRIECSARNGLAQPAHVKQTTYGANDEYAQEA